MKAAVHQLRGMIKKALVAMFLISSTGMYGQSNKITFSEINYKSDSTREAGDWVELHNYDSIPIDVSNWVLTDEFFTHFFILPSGTEIQPQGHLVLVQDTTLFKSQYPSVTNYIGPFSFGLSGKGEQVRLFNDSNQIVADVTYADSLPWPKTPDGHGRTLELIDAKADLNDAASWFPGCMGGSPGTSYQPCTETIVFSEINYSSAEELDAGDWVELRNIGNQQVDISGWVFRDKQDESGLVIPSNTVLDPGEHLVLAEDLQKFGALYPSVNNVVGPFLNFAIGGTGEIIRLFNSQGQLYFSMKYHNEQPWPSGADGGGYTLELADAGKTFEDGTNWFQGCRGGSPGDYYDAACPLNVTVDKVFAEKGSVAVYPHPFYETATLEYRSANGTLAGEVQLEVYDMLGKVVLNKEEATTASGNIKISMDRKGLKAGVYFYRLMNQETKLASGKLMINNR